MDFMYCQQHMNTPLGMNHFQEVVRRGKLTKPSDLEAVRKRGGAVPEKDPHTTVLEQMAEALDRVTFWEEDSQRRLRIIPEDEWIFRNRRGDLGKHPLLQVYEESMDRTVRTLSAASKVALKEKMIQLGKAQTELMIRILQGVVTELALSEVERERANILMLQLLRNRGNISSKLDAHVREQLAIEGEVIE
ncbi:MAG: hypothetical protein PHQ41_02285 [Candidatus Cloacimonetes bacterium]|nr:hypothetical protein [Candidatus Cloacimonadota bacterium]